MKLQIKKKHGQNKEKETPTKKFDNLERKTSRENFQGNQLVVLSKYIDDNLISQNMTTYELFSDVYADYIKFCHDFYFPEIKKQATQLFDDERNPKFSHEKYIHRLKSYNISFLSKKKFSQAFELCLKNKPEFNVVKTRTHQVILKGVSLKTSLPRNI